jgi:hypothetical protein
MNMMRVSLPPAFLAMRAALPTVAARAPSMCAVPRAPRLLQAQEEQVRQGRVREEDLQVLGQAASLSMHHHARGAFPPAVVLSSWRGLSGRRYVVSRRPWLRQPAPGDEQASCEPLPEAAVMLAVHRDGLDRATLLGVMASEPEDGDCVLAWFAAMTMRGARELHVHLLAEDAAARRAVCADLAGSCQAGRDPVATMPTCAARPQARATLASGDACA